MSSCTSASSPPKNSVMTPTMAMTAMTVADCARTGNRRASRNTPAVTIVAAWMSADTGVGPAMASGSHTCSGICPDFEMQPRKMSSVPSTIVEVESWPATAASIVSRKLNGVSVRPNMPAERTMTPTMRPTSPNFVVRNALLAASWFDFSSQ